MPETTPNPSQPKTAASRATPSGPTRNEQPREEKRDDSRGDQSMSQTVEDAKQMGNQLLSAARESVTGALDEQRGRAADQIATIGGALRRSAESLDREAGVPISRYADEAAQRIEDFAELVRERSWNQLARDAEDFARDWPWAFLGAAIGIGFVAGRVLLSAAPRPTPRRAESPQPSAGPTASLPEHGTARAASGSAGAGYGAARENG